MLVAVIMGRQGLNTLLVASQVILSFVLPFVAFPLVWITSNPKYMSVKEERITEILVRENEKVDVEIVERQEHRLIDYSNGKIVMLLGYLIWLVILVANVYVLISLAMGNDGCECSSFFRFLALTNRFLFPYRT